MEKENKIQKVLSMRDKDIQIIPLNKIDAILPSEESPENCFQIELTNKQIIYFQCENGAQMRVWILGLYHAINELNRDPAFIEMTRSQQPSVCLFIYYLIKIL